MKGVTASARGLIRVSWRDIELSLGPIAAADLNRSIARALFDVALTADHHGCSGYLLMLDEAQVLRDEMASTHFHYSSPPSTASRRRRSRSA